MNYSFIYFDLDDTLLDHRSAEKNALKRVWEECNLSEHCTIEQLQDTYHHINVFLWEMYGRGEITREQLQQTRFERTLFRIASPLNWQIVANRYMQLYSEYWTWINGAEKAYQLIKNSYKTGILTNGFADTQRLKLSRFGLNSPDIITLISEDVGIMKPQKGIFEIATKVAGVSASEIVYVGDSYTSDVLGGKNFGWNVAWFTTEQNQEKRANADFVFSNFEELTAFLYL